MKKKQEEEEERDTVGELGVYQGSIQVQTSMSGIRMPLKANHHIMGMKPPKRGGKGPRRRKQYEPLEWKGYFDEVRYMDNGTSVFLTEGKGPFHICFHGAGMCALSFACLAKEVKKFARVAAPDFRGHGYSKHKGKDDDLSIGTLVKDSLEVVDWMIEQFPDATFVIVGHSMGGSVAGNVCKILESLPQAERIIGLVVIDVVEGTAIKALSHMEDFLYNKPKKFMSIQDAIKYTVTSRTVRKIESARVSVPPLLNEMVSEDGRTQYEWKNDLIKSQQFWVGWFKGLTESFLTSKFSKILLLASKERMDKELTIAQMQGKFRLVCFVGDIGHSMMEDDPHQTASALQMLLSKFKLPMNMRDVKRLKEEGVAFFENEVRPYSKH